MSTIGGPLSTVVTPLTPVTITKSILDKPETAEKINSKEQFVCVDVDNQLYQFTIDGHAMDGFRMSPEVNLRSFQQTSLALTGRSEFF